MTVLEFLIYLRDEWHCAPSDNMGRPGLASNGQLRRYLQDGAVAVSGQHPKPEDEMVFPVQELIFFKNKPRQKTIW